MPKSRPAASGYARLAQEEELRDDEDGDADLSESRPLVGPRHVSIQPQPSTMHFPPRESGSSSPTEYRPIRAGSWRAPRLRSNSSGVDIKAINARLERWAEEIASKFKIGRVKGKSADEERLEIHHSVFVPPEGMRPMTAETILGPAEDTEASSISKEQFDEIVGSVRTAIEKGIHPKMISQGSSGSYFARDVEGKIVGVFKPKDEEPYASRNPKWTKWIHRNLFPCFFGRACLIPNLSYISEAAACVLDRQLRTNLVPYTDVIFLSSKSFHYDFWDRRSYYRNGKPLPQKQGSFQVFLEGYKDANVFLREHPWPDRFNSNFRTEAAPKTKNRPWNHACRPSGAPSDEEDSDDGSPISAGEAERWRFFWTDALQQSLREELEKLVILDYIMRNTDRGLDNWMIKVNHQTQQVTIASDPPAMNGFSGEPSSPQTRPANKDQNGTSRIPSPSPYRLQEPMEATSRSTTPSKADRDQLTISIGAIDNSLSWPWKHPDAWRSFPFGWLFLPVSLIGQPFSQKTRDHFLPLLTSTKWWSDTQIALRGIFSQDSDFKERMFARQMAVMKGQAWNVVETLKTSDHGPLELTRRARVCVWDDLVEIPIAVPLKVPSSEMRRKREREMQGAMEEEMDISAAAASAPMPRDHDLLGSPSIAAMTRSAELPNPGRFSLSRIGDDDEQGVEDGGFASPGSPNSIDGTDLSMKSQRPMLSPTSLNRTRTRASYDEPRKPPPRLGRRRGYSVSIGRTRRGNGPNILYNDGEELEGDLGYSAAQDMEGNLRKVIVERLEQVKSKNPVFSWC